MNEASTAVNTKVVVSITSECATSFTARKFVVIGPVFGSDPPVRTVFGQCYKFVLHLAFLYDRWESASGDWCSFVYVRSVSSGDSQSTMSGLRVLLHHPQL